MPAAGLGCGEPATSPTPIRAWRISRRREACGDVIDKSLDSATANAWAASRAKRRIALQLILASATVPLAGLPSLADSALTTPRGSGRPKLARASQLPLATDLARDGRSSVRERKPILLFFDREECPYCERALREYVVPLSKEAWQDRALFRQIEIDLPLPLVDFNGAGSTHEALAARMGVQLSPTVIVVDGKGRTLGGPVVGLTTVDFYGAYLERALETAAEKLG